MTKKLKKEISQASKTMTKEDLYEFLLNIENGTDIIIDYSIISRTIDFASHLVNRMKDSLDNGEWFGYELKALNALDDIDGDENELIRIDIHGYPNKIDDNDELLSILEIDV